MNFRYLVLCAFFCLTGLQPASAREPGVIRYFQNEPRYVYQRELLAHVFKLTEKEYGPVSLTESRPPNMRDDEALMRGLVDVVYTPTSQSREVRFHAIKVPLLQGMLGFRLLLVTPESNKKFVHFRGMKDLHERLIGGAGLYWEDFRIFNHHKVLVKIAHDYELLYSMLASGEIDYFSLGANEIFSELALRKEKYPNLLVNPQVAFFYPFPFYFFVSKRDPALAERIELGLARAEQDGSFKAIFLKHYQDEIEKLKALQLKEVFYLENPNATPQPEMKFEWWLEKEQFDLL